MSLNLFSCCCSRQAATTSPQATTPLVIKRKPSRVRTNNFFKFLKESKDGIIVSFPTQSETPLKSAGPFKCIGKPSSLTFRCDEPPNLLSSTSAKAEKIFWGTLIFTPESTPDGYKATYTLEDEEHSITAYLFLNALNIDNDSQKAIATMTVPTALFGRPCHSMVFEKTHSRKLKT